MLGMSSTCHKNKVFKILHTETGITESSISIPHVRIRLYWIESLSIRYADYELPWNTDVHVELQIECLSCKSNCFTSYCLLYLPDA